jgi:hypothetical protein
MATGHPGEIRGRGGGAQAPTRFFWAQRGCHQVRRGEGALIAPCGETRTPDHRARGNMRAARSLRAFYSAKSIGGLAGFSSNSQREPRRCPHVCGSGWAYARATAGGVGKAEGTIADGAQRSKSPRPEWNQLADSTGTAREATDLIWNNQHFDVTSGRRLIRRIFNPQASWRR